MIDHRFPFRMTYRTALELKLVGSNDKFERRVRKALKLGTYTNPENPNEHCTYKHMFGKTKEKDGVVWYHLDNQVHIQLDVRKPV